MNRARAIDWAFVRRATWWIVPLGFFALTIVVIYKYVLSPKWLGLDASLYTAATGAWLSGLNPWDVSQDGVYFAAPPPSLLPYVAFVWMPAGLVSLVVVAISVGLAVLTIRTLRLPFWWLAFPPLVDGVLVGNANVAVLALLVLASGRLAPLAVFLKIYALIPMIGERRWRQVGITVALLAASLLVLPWGSWFAQLDRINTNLELTSATTSVFGQPVLMAIGVVALLSLGAPSCGLARRPVALAKHAATLRGDLGSGTHPVPGIGVVLPDSRGMARRDLRACSP